MIKDLLLVGLGGGLGSMLRLLTSRISTRFISSQWALIGTFIANIIGCFLIGLLAGWLLTSLGKSQSLSLLLITGFCGGYTHFLLLLSKIYSCGSQVIFYYLFYISFLVLLLHYWRCGLASSWYNAKKHSNLHG